MKTVVVVCKNYAHYRAFCEDTIRLFGVENIKIYQQKLQTKEAKFIPVYVDDVVSYDKIRGIELEKVIIYNCYPKDHLMIKLKSRFRNKRPDIETIWN